MRNTSYNKELLFQFILHLVVLTFYSFNRKDPTISVQELWFFCNYAVAAGLINYYLLPRFFYRKQYLPFSLLLSVVIAIVIIVEESILEPLYFPDTRGSSFPGIISTLVQVLPVIVILVGFKFAWDAIGKQREVEVLRAAAEESELQFLKSQINPHFLFNNLNNLYAYAIEQSPKTPTIILELSAVLRYMLYECKEKYVPISKEIEQLENFTQLNELQIEERGTIQFRHQGINSTYCIAPLILIVFIENAFKHSQASQSEDIEIEIDIRLDPAGKLSFRCFNNFQGQGNTENLAHGIGLDNVKKRLQLLYPNAHHLHIEQGDDQYRVQLSLQLHQAKSQVA